MSTYKNIILYKESKLKINKQFIYSPFQNIPIILKKDLIIMTQHGRDEGYPIVLTASRAEANHYNNNPFAAFICTFPKKISGYILKDHLTNLENNKDGSAKQTIYGLRKIESLLINEFGEENVIVSHYNNLNKLLIEVHIWNKCSVFCIIYCSQRIIRPDINSIITPWSIWHSNRSSKPYIWI